MLNFGEGYELRVFPSGYYRWIATLHCYECNGAPNDRALYDKGPDDPLTADGMDAADAIRNLGDKCPAISPCPKEHD